MRRSIGIHLLPHTTRFSPNARRGGYIYRRYQLNGSQELHDGFFPLLWSGEGERSAWIVSYCQEGIRP